MEFPDTLRYTKEHEWIRLEDDGKTATIGITDFAQSELGDIVFVELEEEGTEIDEDEVFGTVEAVKTVSELFMPMPGTIVAINEDLEVGPQLVNEDPYGAGWMVKIEISDPSSLDGLLSAAEYMEMIG
ncbi:MAG: glycine cleavage system protein GcvH [Rhodothermales bacterium]